MVITTGSSQGHPQPPEAVSTIDVQPRACLLTGSTVNTETASRVWAGVRQAAAHKRELTAQRFALPTGVTADAYLGTLAQMRCTVIITVGDDLHSTAPTAAAGEGPRYIIVSDRPPTAPGTTGLTPSVATASAVASAVLGAVTS
ncbi:hypothetical protein BGM09_13045 [Streptomyces sp. CBMA29]|nr:hypothetical protein [Streptomyces sp. CBMA29]